MDENIKTKNKFWNKVLDIIGFDKKKKWQEINKEIDQKSLDIKLRPDVTLKNISIDGNDNQAFTFDDLKDIKTLEQINLENIIVEDISVLKSLPNLQKLYLKNSKIIKLNSLEELDNISRLTIIDYEKIDGSMFESLTKLKNLETLKVSNIQVSNPSEIIFANNVKNVVISNSKIFVSLPFIEALKDKKIAFENCNLTKIERLDKCKNVYLKNCYDGSPNNGSANANKYVPQKSTSTSERNKKPNENNLPENTELRSAKTSKLEEKNTFEKQNNISISKQEVINKNTVKTFHMNSLENKSSEKNRVLIDICDDENLAKSIAYSMTGKHGMEDSVIEIHKFKDLKNLTLEMHNGKIKSLNGIEYFDNLTSISLNSIDVPNLDVLVNLKNLRVLKVKNSNIKSVNSIIKMQKLFSLELNNINLMDISFLENNKNLTYLNLSNNKLTTIKHLVNLDNLRQLTLSKNNIEYIDDISNMKNLEYIDLSKNSVTDITPLSKLSKLQKITMTDDDLSRTNALNYLKSTSHHVVNKKFQNTISNACLFVEWPVLELFPDINMWKNIARQLKVSIYTKEISLNQLYRVDCLNITGEDDLIAFMNGIYLFKNLKSIQFENVKLESLSNIVYPSGLQTIKVNNSELKTLNWLQAIDGLRQLEIRNSSIEKIELIDFPKFLSSVYFHNNKTNNSNILKKAHDIKTLQLANNKLWIYNEIRNSIKIPIETIFDDDSLAKIVLESLKSENKYVQLRQLKRIVKLNGSTAHETINSLSGIEYLENLNALSLFSVKLEDLEELLKLNQLILFEFFEGSIRNIPKNNMQKNLKIINHANNKPTTKVTESTTKIDTITQTIPQKTSQITKQTIKKQPSAKQLNLEEILSDEKSYDYIQNICKPYDIREELNLVNKKMKKGNYQSVIRFNREVLEYFVLSVLETDKYLENTNRMNLSLRIERLEKEKVIDANLAKHFHSVNELATKTLHHNIKIEKEQALMVLNAMTIIVNNLIKKTNEIK